MREYNGRKVLKHMYARFEAGDSGLPDCICLILLTEDELYVLEDNFDNTYTTHFAIPCSHIKSVGQYNYIEYRKEKRGPLRDMSISARNTAVFGVILGAFLMAFFAWVPMFHAGDGGTSDTFLKIVFNDGINENRQIYFNEAATSSIKAFSKAFCKLQSNKMHM